MIPKTIYPAIPGPSSDTLGVGFNGDYSKAVLNDSVIQCSARSGVMGVLLGQDAPVFYDWRSVGLVTLQPCNWPMRLYDVAGRLVDVTVEGPLAIEHNYLNIGGPLLLDNWNVHKVGGQALQAVFRKPESKIVRPDGMLVLRRFKYLDVGGQESGVGGGASYAISVFATGQSVILDQGHGDCTGLKPWIDNNGVTRASRGALLVESEPPWTNGREPWYPVKQVGPQAWVALQHTTPYLLVSGFAFHHLKPDRPLTRVGGAQIVHFDKCAWWSDDDSARIDIDPPENTWDMKADKVILTGCEGNVHLRYRGTDLGPISALGGGTGSWQSP